MGDTIWIDVQGRGKGELPADNSIMLRLEKHLEEASSELKVAKLSSFYVSAGSWFKKWTWFDPVPALEAVRAIHDHLTIDLNRLGFDPLPSQQSWPERLMKELRECRRVLEEAIAQGKKFRFLIVS